MKADTVLLRALVMVVGTFLVTLRLGVRNILSAVRDPDSATDEARFDVWDLRLAWAFAGLRVVHGSIRWFAPKRVGPRLTFFGLSVVTLAALWARLGSDLSLTL